MSPILKSARGLHLAIVKEMLTLATSGLGLVAALAWNELVKAVVADIVKPYLPQGSTIISLGIYALVVTILAVIVTLQLTKLQERLESPRGSSELPAKDPQH